MMQIPLNGLNGTGKYALVDPEDYGRVNRHSWYYREGYALSNVNGKEVRMHRFIMDENRPDIVIDHKDRNRLNNTRKNLRRFTLRQNANNRSNNTHITCFGESKTIAQWSRDPRCLVSYSILQARLRRGIETWAAILAPAE